MRKYIICFIGLVFYFQTDAQVWSDDLGEIDSLWTNVVGDAQINDFMNEGDTVLYIAGPFKYANDVEVQQIISWNGITFTKYQNGISPFGTINTIVKYNNTLIIGGDFPHASNASNTYNLAMWNGLSWQAFASGGVTGAVRDLITYNDTLFMCGDFEHIDGVEYNKVAAFSNNTWIDIGYWGQWVSSLEILNGELYGGGYYGFRRYLGGTEWEIFPDQPDVWVMDLKTDTINSFLYLGGNFGHIGGIPSYSVTIWDGFKWNYTGTYCTATVMPQAMAIYRGDLYTGCYFYYDNETEWRTSITKWNGESWDSIGGAFNSTIFALEVFRDTLYIGGSFTHWGGDSPIPTHRSKGLVKLYMPDNGCDYLKPRINTYADTFYLYGGEVDVNLYNNNPYVDSWEWDFGTSTGSVTATQAVEYTYTETGEYNVQVTVTDGECVKTANKTIYIEMGNEVPQFEQIDMQVHPNPSSNDFTVQVSLPNYQNAEIKIAGLNGHLRSVIPVTGETTVIPTKGWKAGVYVCNLFVDGKLVKTEKLVFE